MQQFVEAQNRPTTLSELAGATGIDAPYATLIVDKRPALPGSGGVADRQKDRGV